MRKLMCGLAAFAAGAVLVGSPALSQPPDEKGDKGGKFGPGGDKGGKGGFKLGVVLPPFAQDELNLTPDQKTKLAAIEADVRIKLDTLLTDEQKKRLETIRPGGAGGKGGFPGGGGDKGGKGGFPGGGGKGGDKGGDKGGRGERPPV